MKLVLKDRVFAVEQATLGAALPDPYWSKKYNPKGYAGLAWSLTVEAEERELDESWWEPILSHDELRLPVRRWTDVAGQVVSWNRATRAEGEAIGHLYLFEHEDIPRATIRFTARDGLRFRFEWEGLCDVHYDDEYGRDVPFRVEGWATFESVQLNGSDRDTDASMRARLAEHLDVRDFAQSPIRSLGHRYDSGVGMTEAVFTPIVP